MEIIDSFVMEGSAFYTVSLSPGIFVDVKVCADTGLTYIMQNDDGSTVYGVGGPDATIPDFNYDEMSVIALVKEEFALSLINEAIKLGILREGPNGGLWVYKQFEDHSEGWQEVDKRYAAADLVKQDMVYLLSKKIASSSNMPSLADQIHSASTRACETHPASHAKAKEPDHEI